MRILVVEDDKDLNRQLNVALTGAGYAVDAAFDGEEGHFLGDTEPYDVVILDIGLPKMDGISVLEQWRRTARNMPVILLTARDRWSDKVSGMDAGADDYLAKPFQVEELMARVRALIRRSAGHGSPVMEAGPVTIDTRQMKVLINGANIAVSPLEYRLVAYLMHHKGRVVSPSELIEHLYGDDDARDANALEAVVTRLRRKLGADVIQTRRGFGYVLSDGTE